MNAIEQAAANRKRRLEIENRAWEAEIIPGSRSNEELERFLERVNQNPKLADALKKVAADNDGAACRLDWMHGHRKSRVEEIGFIVIDQQESDEEIIKFLVG